MASPYTLAELAHLDEIASNRVRDAEFLAAHPEYRAPVGLSRELTAEEVAAFFTAHGDLQLED